MSNQHRPFFSKPAVSLGAINFALLFFILVGAAIAQSPSPQTSPADAPKKMAHPLIVLKDDAGHNVLETGKPISTRQTCGGDCHDYDFITNSFHFLQGKGEIDRTLLTPI